MDINVQPLQYTREKFFKTGYLPILSEQVEVSQRIEAHSHQFMELALIVDGEGQHFSSQGARKIARGDVFVLRSGAWHAFQACKKLQVYNCCFGSELLQKELAWIRQIPSLNYLLWRGPLTSNDPGLIYFKLSKNALDSCQEYLSIINQLLNVKPEQQKAAILGFLLVFLTEVSNNINPEKFQDKTGHTVAIPQIVLEGVELLEADISRAWTLGDLASILHLDPAYLIRLFKKHTGLSPMAYLNRQRAERAANLLVESLRPINEIAHEVGWPDQNYFARCFKAHFGVSGSVYRYKYRRQ
jgi:AraC family L-rhamnose operon transcriptional activator RhaR